MARTGRPPTPIDASKLDVMMQYGATCSEVANEFNCSEDAIVRYIKRNYKMNYAEYSHKKKGSVRMRLRTKQVELALKGNIPMLIWLGKNILGQSDKMEHATQLSEEDIRKGVFDFD